MLRPRLVAAFAWVAAWSATAAAGGCHPPEQPTVPPPRPTNPTNAPAPSNAVAGNADLDVVDASIVVDAAQPLEAALGALDATASRAR